LTAAACLTGACPSYCRCWPLSPTPRKSATCWFSYPSVKSSWLAHEGSSEHKSEEEADQWNSILYDIRGPHTTYTIKKEREDWIKKNKKLYN